MNIADRIRSKTGIVVEPDSHYIDYIGVALYNNGLKFDGREDWYGSTRSLYNDLEPVGVLDGETQNAETQTDDIGVIIADIFNPVTFGSRFFTQKYQRALANGANTREKRFYASNQQILDAGKMSIAYLADSINMLGITPRVLIFTALFERMEQNPNSIGLAEELRIYMDERIPGNLYIPKASKGNSCTGLFLLDNAIKPLQVPYRGDL